MYRKQKNLDLLEITTVVTTVKRSWIQEENEPWEIYQF